MRKIYILFGTILISNILFGRAESFITILNGNPQDSLLITAIPIGNIYNRSGELMQDIIKSVKVPCNGEMLDLFDWLDEPNGDRTLWFGLYLITCGNTGAFYWDLRDCHVDNRPDDLPWSTSPDLFLVVDNDILTTWTYSSEGASGEFGFEDTIFIGWLHEENYLNPNYHPYYCWEETLLELKNLHSESLIGGILNVDNIEYTSGEYDYFDKNITICLRAEGELLISGNQYVQHHNWSTENIPRELEVDYLTDDADDIHAIFDMKVPSTLSTSTTDIPISIQDPWWVDGNGGQLGDFHELSDTNYKVFKGEGIQGVPNDWPYAVKVNSSEYIIGPHHYIFSGWEVINAEIGPYSQTEINNLLKRKVRFTSDNPIIQAHYIDINAVEGKIFNEFTFDGNRDIVGHLSIPKFLLDSQ